MTENRERRGDEYENNEEKMNDETKKTTPKHEGARIPIENDKAPPKPQHAAH